MIYWTQQGSIQMGIPSFFNWLSKKYPSIVTEIRGNNENEKVKHHFDHLYIDINGIIHNCSHSEYKRNPKNQHEIHMEIFNYIENIMQIVRPKRLLYLAIDGVAPRAKLNQQRSRRFRAAKERREKKLELNRIKTKLMQNGLLDDEQETFDFDSNVITPGTEFMSNLNKVIRQWISEKINFNNEIWHHDLMIILSDASVPGEGEHKILDYIRKQKQENNYGPTLSHCMYGLDADLILLGLASHQQSFTILREKFDPKQPKLCQICYQFNHHFRNCKGILYKSENLVTKVTYLFVRLDVLKQCLQYELSFHLNFDKFNFERIIDDFIFICTFVGNDFLPHLPSLDIRRGALDNLLAIYIEIINRNNNNIQYLNDNGIINLDQVQLILTELGKDEDQLFIRKAQVEFKIELEKLKSHGNNKRKRDQEYGSMVLSQEYDEMTKYCSQWKQRYYQEKFNSNEQVKEQVVREYIKGLCWVMRYIYHGCHDWKWFYPYHYAPLASDCIDINKFKVEFDINSQPMKPLEQLMCVLPPDSSKNLPITWRTLMTDPSSPIIDFYPSDFKIDMNGKKVSWQGVVLLPFIHENRLFNALETVYHDLSQDESDRNEWGENMFVSRK